MSERDVEELAAAMLPYGGKLAARTLLASDWLAKVKADAAAEALTKAADEVDAKFSHRSGPAVVGSGWLRARAAMTGCEVGNPTAGGLTSQTSVATTPEACKCRPLGDTSAGLDLCPVHEATSGEGER